MKKKFDCVELQRNIREQFWIEAGCNIDGLVKLHNERIKDNQLVKDLLKNKVQKKQLDPA
jgi:hypothetical protein